MQDAITGFAEGHRVKPAASRAGDLAAQCPTEKLAETPGKPAPSVQSTATDPPVVASVFLLGSAALWE
jgi:hypothetical protein